jgi:hypothetical protein
MIRVFKIAKDSATKARIQTINQLRAVSMRAEPALREALADLGLVTLVRRCAGPTRKPGGSSDSQRDCCSGSMPTAIPAGSSPAGAGGAYAVGGGAGGEEEGGE